MATFRTKLFCKYIYIFYLVDCLTLNELNFLSKSLFLSPVIIWILIPFLYPPFFLLGFSNWRVLGLRLSWEWRTNSTFVRFRGDKDRTEPVFYLYLIIRKEKSSHFLKGSGKTVERRGRWRGSIEVSWQECRLFLSTSYKGPRRQRLQRVSVHFHPL